MIKLTTKTQQDFLSREWVQKLLDAGVDMSDAKYRIGSYFDGDYVESDDEWSPFLDRVCTNILPTYTVSELLYKLHEWIYPTIDGKEFAGGLKLYKDAPFYPVYYDLKTKNYDKRKLPQEQVSEWNQNYICAEGEYPIESLASVLIQCHKKDIGIKDKKDNQISDTGNISDK